MAINFDLSDEQRAFQSTVAGYLAETCPPRTILSAFESRDLAGTVWKGFSELGLPAILVPEAYGGAGLGILDAAAVAEVIGRYAAPCSAAEHWVATAALAACNDERLKSRWLPLLATGEARASVSFFEDGERWAPDQWTLQPTERLRASRFNVPWGGKIDLVVVGLSGGKIGIVEITEATTIENSSELDATRPLTTLIFADEGCTVLPEGPDLAWRLFDLWSVLLAADACGGASHCLDTTAAYVKEREQFGVPIGQFQGIKHQLADLALQVAPTAGLYWYAAHALDLGLPDASLAASQAKAHIVDVYVAAARKAIELHGGIGYTWEQALHVWLRRSLHDRQYLGGPRKHRERVADLVGW